MGHRKAPPRKNIPRATRQDVLLEAGYKCANPVCRNVLTLELHHIDWVRDGGGNDASNLIALCANCHLLHTKGHVPKDAIHAWKSLLLSLNNPNRMSADLLLVLYDEEKRVTAPGDESEKPPPFRFSGDGLGILAGLITSRLVEISRRFSGVNLYGGGNPSFEVRLTPRGRQLVAAWRKGDAREVEAVLGNDGGTF